MSIDRIDERLGRLGERLAGLPSVVERVMGEVDRAEPGLDFVSKQGSGTYDSLPRPSNPTCFDTPDGLGRPSYKVLRQSLTPRDNTPLTSRGQAFSRNWPDAVNWHATGAVRPPTFQQVHSPRGVSQMGVTWSTSPLIVDSPTTGFRSDPFSLGSTNKRNQFESAPPSPVPHVGGSYYQHHQRRETGLHDP